MIALTALLLTVNLAGVWAAQGNVPPESMLVPGARWVAVPPPIDTHVHVYLYVQPRPDGSLRAFFRNPEANAGVFIRERTLRLNGSTVRLVATGRPELDGRYDARADTVSVHLDQVPGDFTFHRERQPQATPYRDRVPAEDGDGWKTGSLASAGIDAKQIARIIDTNVNVAPSGLRSPYIQSLLIARHGKLVLDEYFNDFSADRPHDVRSAGKSVTTLMLGRAIEDGAKMGPQTRVYDYLNRYAPFAHFDSRKARMTVGNLMSMQSGLACDDNDDASPGNEATMQSQTAQPDWYKYTLDLPMIADPGTRAIYCSADINLLGAVISTATHRRLADYLIDRFARPMQFQRYGIWLVPPPVSDGYMAGGDLFRPRDFLKFGQLFLNRGYWNGVPIIDDAWLRTIAMKRATIEAGGGDYGYGWHLIDYDVNGTTVHAINAGGNGGQLLFVFPHLDMTVMITAANYNQYPVWRTFIQKLVPQLLQAVDHR